jgi:hypothetical protein
MLTPPSKGFALSVTVHNARLDAMAEWLEGCITFVDEEVTKIDVKDILTEEGIYRNQDFAQERIDDAWKELAHRQRCLGQVATFTLTSNRIIRSRKWQNSAAYSFCLMLALQVRYRPSFSAMFGNDFTEQGVLFERLTAESLSATGWRTHSTAWSKTASNSIKDKVEALAKHLGEPELAGAVERWTDAHVKDGGLDVVCDRPFADGWAGRPIYLVQCASGEDWTDKRHTPNISQWTKLVDMATKPSKAISHPFVLLEDDFRRAANYDLLAMILDRHRLCRPGLESKPKWTSTELTKDLNAWTLSRLPALLENEAKSQ